MPPFGKPKPQPPGAPSNVIVEVKDGSSLKASLGAPEYSGGGTVSTYRLDYVKEPFVRERQEISLACSPVPEIQIITTSAANLNEIQYVVVNSGYQGNGMVRVSCRHGIIVCVLPPRERCESGGTWG